MNGEPEPNPEPEPGSDPKPPKPAEKAPETEVGGRDGLEPTRYGDWEKGGIAVDF